MDDLSNPVSTETAYCLFRSFFTEAKITPQASIVSVKTPLPLLHFLVWISPKLMRDLSSGEVIFPSGNIFGNIFWNILPSSNQA